MKKLLGILFLSFVWCSTANAEDKQICDWIVADVYADLLKQESEDHLYVVVGNDGRCEYGRGTEKEDGLSDCEKNRKVKGIKGECKLFAIGEKKILKTETKLTTGCTEADTLLTFFYRCYDYLFTNSVGAFCCQVPFIYRLQNLDILEYYLTHKIQRKYYMNSCHAI